MENRRKRYNKGMSCTQPTSMKKFTAAHISLNAIHAS